MKPILGLVASALLASQLLAACQSGGQPANSPSPNPQASGGLSTLAAPTQAELTALRGTELPAAHTRFALKLFQDLVAEQPRANHFVSPLSLSLALSMLYNGASGETSAEMAKALEYGALDAQTVNSGNLTLRKRLMNAGSGVEVLIANALWGRQGIDFQPAFLQQNQQFYDATLRSLDFNQRESVNTINKWASDNTRGKIPTVLEQINPEIILILMNAIYFKGDWTEPFEVSNTQPMTFTKADGTTLQHPMMARGDKYRYARNEQSGYQMVSLPYGKDQQTEMLLLLPDAGRSVSDLVKGMTSESWQQGLGQLRSRDGRVVMPRFKLKTEIQLNDTLRRLGMVQAFSEAEADLDRLVASDALKPFVSEVKQDAFVEVNEKGTEAAAVTTITVGATSVQLPTEPFEMILDRPFVYAIHDKATGTLLFMGVLNEPQE
ncbi:MAG: serpin family protein [Candidatus Sericytochromatia bacterium]